MTLVDFLSDPKHFVARERLLHTKATLDMKLAAAHCGVQLQVTEPEIDNLGHDFIASVSFDQVYLQNKATLSKANVERWEIHTRFLEASFKDRDLAPVVHGLPVGGMAGAFGGFLLHEVSTEAAALGELKVSYWYFDIILCRSLLSYFLSFCYPLLTFLSSFLLFCYLIILLVIMLSLFILLLSFL